MSSLPSGTVTFLFTDIEGSTKLAQGHPDKWEGLRARHHKILQSAMGAHNGYVFQIIGDAFCVAFHTATDALSSAIKAQMDLFNENWRETPIKVRMGIHTGKAEIQSDGQYHGYLAMSRVQRLMSAAHGGQVLISLATEELVRDELPVNISLKDMGERRLKDLIRPEHIYHLIIPNLPIDFPPIKTLDAYRHNLPVQLTSFIGREKEMEQVAQSINGHRLVTLTGVGGTGKTRLALQSAADLAERFADGVWFVELASIVDAELIPQTILSAFGIGEQQGRTALQVITDYVRERNLLLVLDNCEHLIQACATLTDHLLNNSHELKILATSREALNVKGELTWHVPSLSLPDIKQLPALEHLTQYEAVQLFIERAILVQSNFSVTNDNAPFVAQICSRLDGIPLAIELAAARVRAMSVDQIAKRLDDRFRLLTGGSRTSLERHQTLRAAVDWSYNLLTDEEKKLFRSLAVFSGGWTLEAAESVCGQGGSGFEILDSLTQLVDKSLVNLDESRYRMLETIRQYAQEKLNEAGEVHLARMRHLNYFLAWGEQAEAGIKSREYFLWLERMDKERDNLRAALEYVISTGQAEAALRLIGATFWVWMTRGPWSEGQRWVEDALAIASEEHPAAKAKGLMALGSLLFNQGDLAEANQILKESLMIWQELGDKWWCAFVGSLLGLFLTRSNQPTDSTGVFQESLRLARGVNDPWLLVICLHLFTQHKIHLGKVAEARVLAEESIELIRILGGNFFEGDVIGDLGEIAEAEQDYPRALHWYQEGLNIGQKNNDLDSLTNFEFNMGCVFQKSGDHDQAACHFREALEVSFRSGKRIILVGAVTKLGILAQARGDLRRAVCLLQTGKSLLDNMDETIFGNSMRAEIEQSLEAVRIQLDEKEFSALMMEGQVMTIEQAVAYALEESK